MKRYFVEHSRIIVQQLDKYEEREEGNQQVGLLEKWWALAETLPVAEDTK